MNVTFEQDGALRITGAAPLDHAQLRELKTMVCQSASDPEVRSVVLDGVDVDPGVPRPAVACAGRALGELPLPTVSLVRDRCFGASLALALACDVRLAATSSWFGLPEVRLGIVPDGATCQRLQRVVGVSLAADMLLSGRAVDGEEALAIGLVSRSVPGAALDHEVARLTAELAEGDPAVVAATKRLLGGGRLKPGGHAPAPPSLRVHAPSSERLSG